MKIVSVLGSPRKKGNTARVLGWVEEELVAAGHEVDHLDIVDRTVNGCVECYTCQKKPDEPGCPQEDEAVEIFQRMIAADGVLYASPLFCWGYSAQIKPLIDRHFCLVTDYGGPRYKSLLEGKRAGLLVTCAGPEEDNTESIVDMFTRLMDYAKCKPSLTLVVPFCTTPDAMGDNIREMARRFASRFAAISP